MRHQQQPHCPRAQGRQRLYGPCAMVSSETLAMLSTSALLCRENCAIWRHSQCLPIQAAMSGPASCCLAYEQDSLSMWLVTTYLASEHDDV